MFGVLPGETRWGSRTLHASHHNHVRPANEWSGGGRCADRAGGAGFLARPRGISPGPLGSFAEVPAGWRPLVQVPAVFLAVIYFALPRNDMPIETPVRKLALTTKTLGYPARLRILATLRHNKLSVCQITSVLTVIRPRRPFTSWSFDAQNSSPSTGKESTAEISMNSCGTLIDRISRHH